MSAAEKYELMIGMLMCNILYRAIRRVENILKHVQNYKNMTPEWNLSYAGNKQIIVKKSFRDNEADNEGK